MNIVGALIVVAGFVFLLRALKLIPKGAEVTTISRKALAVLRDSSLDDDAKGELMQAQAKRLFVLFFLLTFGCALALLAPAGLIYALDLAGLFVFNGVMQVLLSWEFLLITTLVSVFVLWALARRP